MDFEEYEERAAMQALRGPLSRRATSSEFNEWMAREICEYIDALRARATEAYEAGAKSESAMWELQKLGQEIEKG